MLLTLAGDTVARWSIGCNRVGCILLHVNPTPQCSSAAADCIYLVADLTYTTSRYILSITKFCKSFSEKTTAVQTASLSGFLFLPVGNDHILYRS